MKRFTIPCSIEGREDTHPFDFYIHQPHADYHPLHFQRLWLKRFRGAELNEVVAESFARLYALAEESRSSFEDLVVYALESASVDEHRAISRRHSNILSFPEHLEMQRESLVRHRDIVEDDEDESATPSMTANYFQAISSDPLERNRQLTLLAEHILPKHSDDPENINTRARQLLIFYLNSMMLDVGRSKSLSAIMELLDSEDPTYQLSILADCEGKKLGSDLLTQVEDLLMLEPTGARSRVLLRLHEAMENWAFAAASPAPSIPVNLFELRRDLQTAFLPRDVLATAIAKGNQALYELAIDCYDGTNGRKRDLLAAARLMIQLAEAGFARAQSVLGYMYFYGDGVEPDDSMNHYWTHKAAENGDAIAEFNMGLDYLYGTGVEKDVAKGLMWIERSAAQNYDRALVKLGQLYYDGTVVERDYAKALALLIQSADQSGDAAYMLGEMYETGKGTAPDIAAALNYYTIAADNDIHEAQIRLNILEPFEVLVEQPYLHPILGSGIIGKVAQGSIEVGDTILSPTSPDRRYRVDRINRVEENIVTPGDFSTKRARKNDRAVLILQGLGDHHLMPGEKLIGEILQQN